MAGRGSFRRRSYRGRDHKGRQPPLPKFTPTPLSTRSSVPPTHTALFKRSGQTFGSFSHPSASRAFAVTGDLICPSCKKIGHTLKGCWRYQGFCLRCGSHDHKLATCPVPAIDRRKSSSQGPLNPSSVSQQAPAPQQVLGLPTKKGPPLPSQKEAFQNHQHSEISVEKKKKIGAVTAG